jgi:tRNA(Arg) A34 adenosine deaminase TadA
MDDERYMRQAIEFARAGVACGQTPFGAVIVRDGAILAGEHNAVWAETDPTAHAEIRAIRAACRQAGRIDLSGATIYSTCEPCPMCFAAIHWARIERIVYGATIADAQSGGFHEIEISNEQLRQLGRLDVEIVAEFLREPCASLFRQWASQQDAKPY